MLVQPELIGQCADVSARTADGIISYAISSLPMPLDCFRGGWLVAFMRESRAPEKGAAWMIE
jgi:hypothetical protein